MVAVLVLVVAVIVLVALWRWVDTLAFVDVDKKATAQLDAVKVAASIAVGGGGLFALYLAARRQRTQELELEARHAEMTQRDRVQYHAEQVAEDSRLRAERVANSNERDAEDRRVTDLYAKSVEQLGSEKAPVRLGGLYALERLAQVNADQRQTVINVICAYLRMPYSIPDRSVVDALEEKRELHMQGDFSGSLPESEELVQARKRYDLERQEHEVRIAARRIISAHFRPIPDSKTGEPTNPMYWPGALRVDLTGAVLVDADFNGCRFAEAVFERAQFHGRTVFIGASFKHTSRFDGAVFRGFAMFGRVRFGRAAAFSGARFCERVHFEQAEMRRADFSQSRFDGRSHFLTAKFLGRASFEDAIFYEDVRFNRASFENGVLFRRVNFWGRADFDEANFGGESKFQQSRFRDQVHFAKISGARCVDMTGVRVNVPEGRPIPRVWPSGWKAIDNMKLNSKGERWESLVRSVETQSD